MDPVKTASAVRLLAELARRLLDARPGTDWEITVNPDGAGNVTCYADYGRDPDPLVVTHFLDPDNLPEVLEKLGIISEDDS